MAFGESQAPFLGEAAEKWTPDFAGERSEISPPG
jgi:hypothetical protein